MAHPNSIIQKAQVAEKDFLLVVQGTDDESTRNWSTVRSKWKALENGWYKAGSAQWFLRP
jgi:hypothetical protein